MFENNERVVLFFSTSILFIPSSSNSNMHGIKAV